MKYMWLFFMLLGSLCGIAQHNYQVGLLPSINFSKKLNEAWKFNLKIESRHRFSEGVFNDKKKSDYNYLLTDYAGIVSKKTGLNNAIALGYLARFESGQTVHRLIQQFTVTRRYTSFRLAHRFSADQTFEKYDANEYRLRYRFTPEIPLEGQSVDAKELYIKINNEYLTSLQDNAYDLEIRVVPLLGYEFSNYNKIEVGLDYRISSFIEDQTRSVFWGTLNWFVAF